MNADETEIYEFLKTRGENYVSVSEISRALGRGKFQKDRNWARPILRRMEMDGVLESNPYGEYRIKGAGEVSDVSKSTDTDFKKALRTGGAELGDTTIIRITD